MMTPGLSDAEATLAGVGPGYPYVLGIDPGPDKSGVVFLGPDGVNWHELLTLDEIREAFSSPIDSSDSGPIAIEDVDSFGMRVGREVFDTVRNVGRMLEFMGPNVHLITRREVKLTIVGSARANDADVRLAILEMFGGKAKAIGTKKDPGPLYGVKGHCWAALAVALAFRARGA